MVFSFCICCLRLFQESVATEALLTHSGGVGSCAFVDALKFLFLQHLTVRICCGISLYKLVNLVEMNNMLDHEPWINVCNSTHLKNKLVPGGFKRPGRCIDVTSIV